jgi:hypothetical protein
MDKRFLAILGVIIVIFLGIFIVTKSSNNKANPPSEKLGVYHPEQSKDHIPRGQQHEPYSSDPPSSGPHYADAGAPAPWGVYIEEVPDEVFLHNEEHGGVIVTYNPNLLPADQIKKLQTLFAPPYSNPNFKPNRAIVTPRSKNTKPIQLAAWTYTLNLDSYDEAKLMNFYLQRVNRAPEPGAGPTNAPIDQTKQ